MNAVKNCLVVLAAAVALASCSADPTKDLGGKDLVISVTPGTVNARVGDTLEVFASAQDALGGATFGSFTITGGTGPAFTATIDSTYTPVYAGTRPQGRTRIVVAALQTTDGSFTVSGTGGSATVKVRIAPDSTGSSFSLANATPGVGVPDTITAPSGTVYLGGLSITNAFGDSAATLQGYAAASILGFSADSTKMFFLAAPTAHGHIKATMANRTSPTLTYTSVSSDTIHAATYDSANAGVTFSSLTPAFLDTITATAPAGFRWGAASAPTLPAVGGVAPVLFGFSADSTQIRFMVGPSANGKVTFPAMLFTIDPSVFFSVSSSGTIVGGASDSVLPMTFSSAAPAGLAPDTITLAAPYRFAAGFSPSAKVGGTKVALFTIDTTHHDSSTAIIIPIPGSSGPVVLTGIIHQRAPKYTLTGTSATSITAGAAPVVATYSPAAPALNVADTITLSGSSFRFRPTSSVTAGGLPGIVISVSADSTKMVVIPPPGTNGPLTITNLWYVGAPATNFSLATVASVTVGALASIGQDGPTGTIPTIQLPVKGNYGFWDLGTFDSTDYSADGGAGAQYYRYNLGVAAKINTRVDWNVGNDIDVILLKDDGTYSHPADGFSGASAAAFETSKSNALIVGTYLFDVINYGPLDTGGTSSVGSTIRFQITVF